MSLQLSLRSSIQKTPTQILPIDASPLTPDRIVGLGLDAVRRTPLLLGNGSVEAGELFDVSGTTDEKKVAFAGSNVALNFVGAKMASGEIHVSGNVGRHLGQEMSGGAIRVAGNAGDGAGAAMRGGLIQIDGNAGDDVGGALPGESYGMNRGCILVNGNAGNHVGKSMRRGLISIAGDVGSFAAREMRAGTIILGGKVTLPIAPKMVRGTVILTNTNRSFEPPPTFFRNGVQSPLIVQMIQRWLEKVNKAHAQRLFTGKPNPCPALLYSGDHLVSGRGELLVFSNFDGDNT